MRLYLQMPATDDKPPRYYQLLLQQDLLGGWTLVREWGAQGTSGRTRREHFASREDAQAALLRARDAQLARGYRLVFAAGEGAPR